MAASTRRTKCATWSPTPPSAASPSCPRLNCPGTAVAALAAYPELGCVGEGYQVRRNWGIADDIFLRRQGRGLHLFLKDVLSEVLELFPSTYIHIGG